MKQKNAHPVAVGIDVAKLSLSVCVRYHDGTERALTIRNTEADINTKLLPVLTQCTPRVVMESTGHYHVLVALLLTDVGHDVRVVNPILAKQYTSGNVRKVKTDPADARGLARMALVADNLPNPFVLDRNTIGLRKKLAMLGSMNHQRQALIASLQSFDELRITLGQDTSPAVEMVRTSIKELERAMRTLERECVHEVRANASTQHDLSLITSIPGVSEFCGVLALQWFRLLPDTTTKSWIAYAGLDVSSRESGTWKGRCKLTKRGNAFLRRRLYSAAWGATMNNADFKEYYDHLRIREGRAHVEALTIIARKIVRTMYHVIQSNTVYDPSKFGHKYLSTPTTA